MSGSDSIQGDIRFVEAAEAMGAQVRRGPGWLEVHRGRWPLRGITLDCNHIPDAAMTLAVMALYADGPTRLTGIASWRVKETDRIAAMAAELRKLGATVVEGRRLHRGAARPPPGRPAAIHTYDDHRMAMCLSLAAFNPLARRGGNVPVRILDPHCVAKTFPDYFEALFGLAHADAAGRAGDHHRRPHRLGQGHAGGRGGRRAGLRTCSTRARCTAPPAWRRSWDGVSPDDEAGRGRLAGMLDLRFGHGPDGSRTWLRGREVSDELRQETAGLLASRVSALPAVRRRCTGCSWPSAARRAWWPTGATWAPWSSPTRR